MAPRKGQRDFIPTAIAGRNLDIIRSTDTVESSATLAAGEDTTFTITTASKLGVPIWVQEDISLFETSVAEANLIPNGSSITASHYQIIGPWRDQSSGDGKNIVSKIFVRNSTGGTIDKNLVSDDDEGYWDNTISTWKDGSIDIRMGNDSSFVSTDMSLRFTGISIPQGETINSASISITAAAGGPAQVDTIIHAYDEDNTANFASDPRGRNRTTAGEAWELHGVNFNEEYTSPDISSVIQEIVDRGGWSSGNAIGFVFEDDSDIGAQQHNFYSYQATPAKSALLTIVYSVPGSKTVLFRGRTRYITPIDDVTIE